MITKIECFTAAIQLITAVNFTFIFTHLPHYVFKQILKYDSVCRSKFKRYRDVKLGGISDDIANMKGIVINGVNTLNHKEELQKKIDEISAYWTSCEDKSISTINRLCKTKGFKCLFLFISVFCVFDLIAIPILKIWESDYIITLMSLINIIAMFYTLRLSWITLHSKWNKKPDWVCYNKTAWYLIFTFVGIIPVWILVHSLSLFINNLLCFDAVEILKEIWAFDIWCFLFLPFYPYAFSVLYIFGTVAIINVMRCWWRIILWIRISRLERKKKKIDVAYATLTKIDWEN